MPEIMEILKRLYLAASEASNRIPALQEPAAAGKC